MKLVLVIMMNKIAPKFAISKAVYKSRIVIAAKLFPSQVKSLSKYSPRNIDNFIRGKGK